MKLIKTFVKYATGSMFALLAGLITTPILTRLISTEEMGKYSMFITLGSLFASILYLGLDQSYVRFYNDEHKDSQVALLNKCLRYPVVATAIVAALLVVFYQTLSNVIIGQASLALVPLWVSSGSILAFEDQNESESRSLFDSKRHPKTFLSSYCSNLVLYIVR